MSINLADAVRRKTVRRRKRDERWRRDVQIEELSYARLDYAKEWNSGFFAQYVLDMTKNEMDRRP